MNDDRNKLTHFAAPTLFDLNETIVTSRHRLSHKSRSHPSAPVARLVMFDINFTVVSQSY